MSKNELPDGWKWSTLGKVCEINPRRPSKLEVNDNQETSFVPMESVDGDLGIILDMKVSPFSNVKKGYTYFEENDVLFAKITPCMQNKKSAIANGLINGFGFGTTEFHVLRCKDRVILKWIYYFIRNQRFIDEAQKNFTGAVGQQRVPTTFLENYPIIVPPIPEQERIASKLDRQMAQIEMMKKEAEKQEEALYSLLLSYISEKFDESFPTEKLSFLVDEIKNGVYKPPSFRGNGHKLVRMYNIENDSINLNDNSLELIELTNDELENYTLRKGDVLISRVNSAELVGKCGVIKDKLVGYAYENMVMRVRVNSLKLIPDYLAYFLISPKGKNEIRSRAKHAINQSSISNKDVGDISVPLPLTLNVQKEIVRDLDSKFEYIEGLKNQIKIQLTAVECLKSSILKEVFGKYEIPDET